MTAPRAERHRTRLRSMAVAPLLGLSLCWYPGADRAEGAATSFDRAVAKRSGVYLDENFRETGTQYQAGHVISVQGYWEPEQRHLIVSHDRMVRAEDFLTHPIGDPGRPPLKGEKLTITAEIAPVQDEYDRSDDLDLLHLDDERAPGQFKTLRVLYQGDVVVACGRQQEGPVAGRPRRKWLVEIEASGHTVRGWLAARCTEPVRRPESFTRSALSYFRSRCTGIDVKALRKVEDLDTRGQHLPALEELLRALNYRLTPNVRLDLAREYAELRRQPPGVSRARWREMVAQAEKGWPGSQPPCTVAEWARRAREAVGFLADQTRAVAQARLEFCRRRCSWEGLCSAWNGLEESASEEARRRWKKADNQWQLLDGPGDFDAYRACVLAKRALPLGRSAIELALRPYAELSFMPPIERETVAGSLDVTLSVKANVGFNLHLSRIGGGTTTKVVPVGLRPYLVGDDLPMPRPMPYVSMGLDVASMPHRSLPAPMPPTWTVGGPAASRIPVEPCTIDHQATCTVDGLRPGSNTIYAEASLPTGPRPYRARTPQPVQMTVRRLPYQRLHLVALAASHFRHEPWSGRPLSHAAEHAVRLACLALNLWGVSEDDLTIRLDQRSLDGLRQLVAQAYLRDQWRGAWTEDQAFHAIQSRAAVLTYDSARTALDRLKSRRHYGSEDGVVIFVSSHGCVSTWTGESKGYIAMPHTRAPQAANLTFSAIAMDRFLGSIGRGTEDWAPKHTLCIVDADHAERTIDDVADARHDSLGDGERSASVLVVHSARRILTRRGEPHGPTQRRAFADLVIAALARPRPDQDSGDWLTCLELAQHLQRPAPHEAGPVPIAYGHRAGANSRMFLPKSGGHRVAVGH